MRSYLKNAARLRSTPDAYETAKLNGLEPQAYIADVMAKIAGNWPAAHWDELMPWNWQPDNQAIAEAA